MWLLGKKTGFTLIELMMTLAALGVLAAIAIPSYRNTVEQARQNEADVNLQIIRTGEKIYALNDPSGNYWNPTEAGSFPYLSLTTVNSTLNIDISTSYYDLIFINATAGTALSVRFRRNASSGGNGTSTRQITQDGTIS